MRFIMLTDIPNMTLLFSLLLDSAHRLSLEALLEEWLTGYVHIVDIVLH